MCMDMDKLQDWPPHHRKPERATIAATEDSSCAWGFVRSLKDGTPSVGATNEHVERRSELWESLRAGACDARDSMIIMIAVVVLW